MLHYCYPHNASMQRDDLTRRRATTNYRHPDARPHSSPAPLHCIQDQEFPRACNLSLTWIAGGVDMHACMHGKVIVYALSRLSISTFSASCRQMLRHELSRVTTTCILFFFLGNDLHSSTISTKDGVAFRGMYIEVDLLVEDPGTRPAAAASADIASVRKLYTTKVAWSKLKSAHSRL